MEELIIYEDANGNQYVKGNIGGDNTINWKEKNLGLWDYCIMSEELIKHFCKNTGIKITEREDNMEKLIEKISNDSVANIEDFLGYVISSDVLEGLPDRIEEVLNQMPEEEINKYKVKYGIGIECEAEVDKEY